MLKGISDSGMKRIAQTMNDGGPPYSGSRDKLLENTQARLFDEVDNEFTLGEIEELIDSVNSKPDGLRLLTGKLRSIGVTQDDLDQVIDIIAWASHEMLDYDFQDNSEGR